MNIEALRTLSSDHSNGTSQYYRHQLARSVVYTDGARALAIAGQCYWLLDLVAFCQNKPMIRNDESLRQMQFWTLRKGEGNSAVLVCERDNDDPAFSQEIEFTDFPFHAMENNEVRLWVAPTSLDGEKTVMVIYLPSEH